MNTKEFNQFVELFAFQANMTLERAQDLVLNAIAAYTAKVMSNNRGKYIAKFEDSKFEVFREWELVPDDCVMEDPELQWRVMDAVDEGFDDALAGDVVQVQVASPEASRAFSAWVHQYLAREVAKTKRIRAKVHA